MSEPNGPPVQTFAEKLEWLFTHVKNAAGQPYTIAEIARLSGMSESQISNLRRNRSSNPTLDNVRSLCRAFGVTTKIFLDDSGIEQAKAELALLAALQRQDIRDLALRAHQLDPEAVRNLAQFIASLQPGDTGDK